MPVRQRSRNARAVTPVAKRKDSDIFKIVQEGGGRKEENEANDQILQFSSVLTSDLLPAMGAFLGKEITVGKACSKVLEDAITKIVKPFQAAAGMVNAIEVTFRNLAKDEKNRANQAFLLALTPAFRNALKDSITKLENLKQGGVVTFEGSTKDLLESFQGIESIPTGESAFKRLVSFLNSVKCPTEQESELQDPEPTVTSFDTTLIDFLNTLGSFDTPDAILEWFRETDTSGRLTNYYAYLYGVGKILKTKQQLLQKAANSLQEQISKINVDYDNGIAMISTVVPSLPPMNPDFQKKLDLINKITSDTNDSYKTQFMELLQKKMRYDETIERLTNRRAYLVYWLNQSDQGFHQIVEQNIMTLAKDIYSYYRGSRYTLIRKMIFGYVKMCAFNPEIIEKSFILNTSITGPAGSGKTTLARKLATWYSAVGFLTKDSFLEDGNMSYREVGAPELIAQYVGQTAPRTLAALYSSLEQCLFIDEAYSVAGCAFDKQGKLEPSPYGEEFIATLLPFMANHQGIGCILVAGYKNLMNMCFFQRNEGLPRRFPTLIDLPLYTTDELYDMFLNFNIVRRQAASIRGPSPAETAELKKEFRRGKQIIYIGLKPAFLILHYDTSYSAFEILRKYLLLYQIRESQFKADPTYKKAVPTHSFTITNHILTCILSSPLRRNILRYYFYDKVFNFTPQNQSWFPAQAGEMGLVADMANKKIEVEMNEKKKTNPQGYISIEQETDVFGTYYQNKPIHLVYFKKQNEPVYVELIQRGYENEKEEFQQKIGDILIRDILKGIDCEPVAAPKVTPATPPPSPGPPPPAPPAGPSPSSPSTPLLEGYCPLSNRGKNMCYMNSVTQLLWSVPEFQEKLLTGEEKKITCAGDYKKIYDSMKMLFEVINERVTNRKSTPINMEAIKLQDNTSVYDTLLETLQRISSSGGFQKGDQEDAQEYLAHLLQYLSNCVDKIQEPFEFGRVTTTKCQEPLYNNSQYDRIVMELLEELNTSIQASIDAQGTKVETLEELKVQDENSGEETPCVTNPTKQITLSILPTTKYLILFLKRFDANKMKVTTPVAVDPIITVDKVSFRIKGVVIHSGPSIAQGHYVYQVYENGVAKKIISDEQVLDANRYDATTDGYIFLYERVLPPQSGGAGEAPVPPVGAAPVPPAVSTAGVTPTQLPTPPAPIPPPTNTTPVTVPSLYTLWQCLFTKSDQIFTNAVAKYAEIAEKVLPELLKISEDKFPVNMLKSEVENEKTLLDFYKLKTTSSGLYLSEQEAFLRHMAKYTLKSPITLTHPAMIENSDAKKIEEALWEDFAFKDSD